MSRGFPSMTALLGLLAIAGYQNRDKIGEMLGRLGQTKPGADGQHGLGGLLGQLGLGGASAGGGWMKECTTARCARTAIAASHQSIIDIGG